MRYIYAAALVAAYLLIAPIVVHAHDWYTGQKNVYGNSCCYGEGMAKDCDHVPFASIREVEHGYIITLTKEQMLQIRPGLKGSYVFERVKFGISEFVHAKEAKPALDGGYSVCLSNYPKQVGPQAGPLRWIICFFYPTNS